MANEPTPEVVIRKIKTVEPTKKDGVYSVTFESGERALASSKYLSLPIEVGMEGPSIIGPIEKRDKSGTFISLQQWGDKKEKPARTYGGNNSSSRGGGGYQKSPTDSVAIMAQVGYKLAFEFLNGDIDQILSAGDRITEAMLKTTNRLSPDYGSVQGVSATPPQQQQSPPPTVKPSPRTAEPSTPEPPTEVKIVTSPTEDQWKAWVKSLHLDQQEFERLEFVCERFANRHSHAVFSELCAKGMNRADVLGWMYADWEGWPQRDDDDIKGIMSEFNIKPGPSTNIKKYPRLPFPNWMRERFQDALSRGINLDNLINTNKSWHALTAAVLATPRAEKKEGDAA